MNMLTRSPERIFNPMHYAGNYVIFMMHILCFELRSYGNAGFSVGSMWLKWVKSSKMPHLHMLSFTFYNTLCKHNIVNV